MGSELCHNNTLAGSNSKWFYRSVSEAAQRCVFTSSTLYFSLGVLPLLMCVFWYGLAVFVLVMTRDSILCVIPVYMWLANDRNPHLYLEMSPQPHRLSSDEPDQKPKAAIFHLKSSRKKFLERDAALNLNHAFKTERWTERVCFMSKKESGIGSSVADPGGPLTPRFLHNHAVFRQLQGKNPYFEQILGSGPPFGSKLHRGPALGQNPGFAPGHPQFQVIFCTNLKQFVS